MRVLPARVHEVTSRHVIRCCSTQEIRVQMKAHECSLRVRRGFNEGSMRLCLALPPYLTCSTTLPHRNRYFRRPL